MFKLFFNDKLKTKYNELKSKYKGKRVILYGAGSYCQELLEKFDFSDLNIVAIADKKFAGNDSTDTFGFKSISPYKILDYNPDVIIVTMLHEYHAMKFISENLLEEIDNFEIASLSLDPVNNNIWERIRRICLRKGLEEDYYSI